LLFVDDEVNILNALRRMLYSYKDEWEMAFLDSGAKALAYLAKNEVDLIVADMRMPEMSGAELFWTLPYLKQNKIENIFIVKVQGE